MGRIGFAKGRALCIGINTYPGTNANLNGCVNDANAWARILGGNYSYEVSKRLEADATREGILDGLKSIVGQSQPKDRVIITFSGHGTFVPDDSGDEADKADEAWCPYDVTSQGAIKDDEIAAIFRTAPKGVRIVMISDSCHSGTMARAAIRAALPDEPGGNNRVRFLPPMLWYPDPYRTARASQVHTPPPVHIDSQSPALLLAGCQDSESSYDAWFNGTPMGAFSYYATSLLKDLMSAPTTYAKWMSEIRKSLPSSRYPQTPQLYGTKTQTNWRVFA